MSEFAMLNPRDPEQMETLLCIFSGLLERAGGSYHYTREEHAKVAGRFVRFRKLEDGTFLAQFEGEPRA